MHIKIFGLKLLTLKDSSRSDWWFVQLANLIFFPNYPNIFKNFWFNAYGIVCIIPQIAIDIRRTIWKRLEMDLY